jgi:hypothetical protein
VREVPCWGTRNFGATVKELFAAATWRSGFVSPRLSAISEKEDKRVYCSEFIVHSLLFTVRELSYISVIFNVRLKVVCLPGCDVLYLGKKNAKNSEEPSAACQFFCPEDAGNVFSEMFVPFYRVTPCHISDVKSSVYELPCVRFGGQLVVCCLRLGAGTTVARICYLYLSLSLPQCWWQRFTSVVFYPQKSKVKSSGDTSIYIYIYFFFIWGVVFVV